MYDIIIIGAGPAGLTAAMYSCRAGKSVLLIEKKTFGGQMTYSPKIENYPALFSISGNELADKMVEQVMALGAEIEVDSVTGIKSNPDGTKAVMGLFSEYTGRAVIIATGSEHRKLGVDNEEKHVGKGIYFCAVCDGAFYMNKNIGVIGGGNSAMQEAILLSDTCSRVTMIQNLDCFTGEEALARQIEAKKNISVMFGSAVCAVIEENNEFKGIKVNKNGIVNDYYFDAIFVAIGLSPVNHIFTNVVSLDGRGYISSSEECRTGTPGILRPVIAGVKVFVK